MVSSSDYKKNKSLKINNRDFSPEWISRDLGITYDDIDGVLKRITVDISPYNVPDLQKCEEQLGFITAAPTSLQKRRGKK
jgi:hypothetical protein|uniref:Uncharacterized protein n=1 Tax=viral metagenome TaxID=1070528 RepID=A0A6C0LTE7_9ZZZZ